MIISDDEKSGVVVAASPEKAETLRSGNLCSRDKLINDMTPINSVVGPVWDL
jgi:hypothetical protein